MVKSPIRPENYQIPDIIGYLRLLKTAGFGMKIQNINNRFPSYVEQVLASNIHTTNGAGLAHDL